ncbi:MAG: helix-turn-helix transcriptional regulator [Bradyrhizobiaceae bacterium]|nr:helix-turn-helix transcriptional regulator [Bradyrhizobiaceae bacterium]
MRTSVVDEQALLSVSSRLGDAVINPTIWPEIMEQICIAAGATGAGLLQSDARTPDVPRTASIDELFRRYFAEGWHLRDARQKCVPRLLAGESVVTDQDINTAEEIERSDYYQNLLASFGLKWFAGIGFWSGSALWVLTLQRTQRAGPFEPSETRMLSTLRERLTEVATLSSSVGRIALTSGMRALDGLGEPAIALDRLGFVLDMNAAAEEIFDDEFRVRGRRLFVRDPQAKSLLDAFIARSCIMPDTGPLAVTTFVVRRRAKRPLFIRIVPIAGAARAPFVGGRALLLMSDLSRKSHPQTDVLVQTFGLSRAEARLASLIAAGISPEQAAEELGIACVTARNQLKAVFAKTDTHRQSELVALLSRL